MTLVEFLILLAVAGVCGAIGQALVGVTRGGCLVSIVLGMIGAFLGIWIARQLNLPKVFTLDVGGTEFPIVWSVVGSALFVALLGLFTRSRRRAG